LKALKTIVATAVIVFALTTVAMAGVQHFTKAQSTQAAGKAPVHYTVTLTAKQLAQLMGRQGQVMSSKRTAHAQRTQRRHHARRYQRCSGASHRSYGGASSGTSRAGSGRSSNHHSGYGHSGNGWSNGSSGSHSGSGWGGGGCW
jgi:hypothetical protein